MMDPDLEPLDRDTQDLFAAERDRPKMRDVDRARLLDRVNATVGAGPAGGSGEAGPPIDGPTPTAGLGSGLLSKIGAGALAVAAVVGAGAYLSSRVDDAPSAVVD